MARPRSLIPPATGPERARAARERALAAGGKRLQTMLSTEAATALEALRQPGETDRALVERLVIEAAK